MSALWTLDSLAVTRSGASISDHGAIANPKIALQYHGPHTGRSNARDQHGLKHALSGMDSIQAYTAPSLLKTRYTYTSNMSASEQVQGLLSLHSPSLTSVWCSVALVGLLCSTTLDVGRQSRLPSPSLDAALLPPSLGAVPLHDHIIKPATDIKHHPSMLLLISRSPE